MEHGERRRRAADADIPEKFSRAPLRHEARSGFGGGDARHCELDRWILFLEGSDSGLDIIALVEKDGELALFSRRRGRPGPIELGLGGIGVYRNNERE